jgi:hypothetical protein
MEEWQGFAEGRRKMLGKEDGRNWFCRGKKKDVGLTIQKNKTGFAEGRRKMLTEQKEEWKGFVEGRRKMLGWANGRMNGFCRGKKKDFGFSRCKNVSVL